MTKHDISNTIPATLREGGKATALLALLQRTEGASLDDMTERTGWQGHSVRAAMTGLRKKGYVIAKRMPGNVTVWYIDADVAAVSGAAEVAGEAPAPEDAA